MTQNQKIFSWFYVPVCLFASLLFLGKGCCSPTPQEKGNWIHVGDDGSTEVRYACPNGRLVGNVWRASYDGQQYNLHIYDSNLESWGKIEETYRDKASAQLAAERFVGQHPRICQ